jgi:RHS repeat-associated protein
MIMKQVPGALPVYMVYDKLDRLVMTQDGEQRTTNKWAYTKYDYLNRPVITGIYTHSGVADQTAMTGLISSVNLSETYDGTGTHGYSNIVFPTASTEILTVTYYDNYKFKSVLAAGTGFDYKSNELTGQETVEWTRIKGLVTGTRNKVLNSTVYLSTVNYYDAKYRLIQSITHNNHRTAANTDLDVVTNVYDFVQLLESRLSHTRAGATYKIKRRFVYDHAGRVLKLYHLIGTDITKEVLLYENVYNKTGQLISKKLHSRNNETAKQIVDYRYNIRGWLQKINDVETPDEADLFKMSLNYNTPSSNGGLAQFNGNISEIAWNTAGADKQSYGYSYDQLNRLTNANYFNQSRPGNNTRFNEAISQYDLNGNIQKLTRNGKKDASNFGLMDDLQYAYTGNQLTKVDDAIVKNDLEGGFKELVKTTNEYLYNNNGAMKRDDNKGLTSIIYNHLNLPQRVERSATEYIIYTYDATGRKLSQQVFGATPKTTDYIGEFIYEDNVLKFVNHDEGRVINVGSVAPEYQYHLKDHLGNVRLTFTENKTTSSYLATMETDRQATEQGIFKGYTNGVRSPMPIENHTTSGTYSQLLNGGNGSQVGLAKSLAVNVGDIVDLEVYAKYEEPAGSGNSPAGLRNALISAFGISASGPTPMDGSQALNAFNQSYPTGILAGTSGYPYEDATAPKAYLNYILFDENFVLQDFGFDQIGLNAKQVGVTPVVPHDYMNLHVKVKKKGYLYVYLSNEQAVPTNVYFDDFKINHHTSIEQFDDYYPFGLTFNSYTRENTTAQDYKYNGKELQDELNLNWLDYGARMYDPTISRWMAVDPKSELARRWSPYTYCYNNPLIFVDPDGMFGDLYNLNGQHIGNDGNDDNKVYLANTQSDQQLDQEQTQASIESGLLVTELDVRNGTPSVDLVPIGNDELNTNATLATIRESEGHGTPTGYNTQYGGKTFDSYADHPREAVTKWGKTSTAAGAYQFLAGTWDAHSSKLGLKDFSPANQDKAAIAEISMVKGAMDLVKKGDYETALPKLSGKWTSLPGGKHQWKGFSNSIFLKHRANELLGKSIVGK